MTHVIVLSDDLHLTLKCDAVILTPENRTDRCLSKIVFPRWRTVPHDLARLEAVNDHGWSHESSAYKCLDFCRACSARYGRTGLLEVEVDGVHFA